MKETFFLPNMWICTPESIPSKRPIPLLCLKTRPSPAGLLKIALTVFCPIIRHINKEYIFSSMVSLSLTAANSTAVKRRRHAFFLSCLQTFSISVTPCYIFSLSFFTFDSNVYMPSFPLDTVISTSVPSNISMHHVYFY